MSQGRHRSVITREGWYYLFILGFVVLGSLVRNIEILVGLSAILATAMIFNWRWGRLTLRSLYIKRLPGEPLWADRLSVFRSELSHRRSGLSAFGVSVEQSFAPSRVAATGEAPEPWAVKWRRWLFGQTQLQLDLIDAIHPGQSVTAVHRVVFQRRGEYTAGPMRVSTHFPLGLVRREWVDAEKRRLSVGPAVGTLGQNWVDQMLGLGWTDAQNGQSARSGEEFFSLRPYSRGDSQRLIHWRASARHNALLVRQFQRSQAKSFSLVVDLLRPEFGRDSDGGAASRVAEDATETILRVLATISENVRQSRLDSVHLVLLGTEKTEIRFPCVDADWEAWHHALAVASPHGDFHQLPNYLRHLANASDSKENIVRIGNAPLVVLSSATRSDYDQALGSVNALDERLNGVDAVATDPTPLVVNGNGQTAANLRAAELSGFPSQPSIRSWFVPTDLLLSGWYVDPLPLEEPSSPLEADSEGTAAKAARVNRGRQAAAASQTEINRSKALR